MPGKSRLTGPAATAARAPAALTPVQLSSVDYTAVQPAVRGEDVGSLVSQTIDRAVSGLRNELLALLSGRLTNVQQSADSAGGKVTELQAEVVKLRNELANVKQQLEDLRHSASSSTTSNNNVGTLKSNKQALAVVHTEFTDQARRNKNIVVTGLGPSSDVTDRELFLQLCQNFLPIKPFVTDDGCKRLGRPTVGRIQPLLVTLHSETAVEELINVAPLLRRATSSAISSSVFINRDLTPAAALAAYQRREERRCRARATDAAGTSGQAVNHIATLPGTSLFSDSSPGVSDVSANLSTVQPAHTTILRPAAAVFNPAPSSDRDLDGPNNFTAESPNLEDNRLANIRKQRLDNISARRHLTTEASATSSSLPVPNYTSGTPTVEFISRQESSAAAPSTCSPQNDLDSMPTGTPSVEFTQCV